MIGEQIKFYRKDKQVKQDELAEYLGVSTQAVSKWETGASTPDISLLPKIAIFFGISIDELFAMPYEEQMERIENMIWTERKIPDEVFTKSISFLENAMRDNPKDVNAVINLAYLYNHRAASDHENASYYAQLALELNPEEKAGMVAYLEANGGVCGDEWYDNHFEVIRFLQAYLVKHPGHYGALYSLIENMLADQRYDEAVPYIEELKKVRKNHLYLQYKGDIAFGKGDFCEAKKCWDQMIVEFPDTWQAFCGAGEGYVRLGEDAMAIEMFEKCFTMQEAPRIYDGLCAMAQIYEKQKDYVKAAETNARIVTCLKEEHGIKDGAYVERYQGEVERFKKMK